MQKTATRDTRLSSAEPLITPAELIEQLPIPSEVEQTVLEGREQVERIIDGKDNRLMAVVGPCSIHDEEAALEYAGRVKDLTKKLSDRLLIVMRVYFEKPRTTVGWKGFIYDPNLNHTFDIASGLRRARALLLKIGELGVYAGTEFLDPIVPQYIAGLVSWVAIGARTTESQTHRQMASGLSMPVGFKNSTDGSTQVAADAITSARSPHAFLGIDRHGRSAIVHTTGNPYGHMVLRGGKRGTNYGREAIAEAHRQLTAAGVRSRLLVDCSLNQESRRIVGGLRAPGRSQAEILSVLTFRRPDGREIPLAEMPTERALKSGETVRAEEIIIELPDGRAVTTVVNATPIFSEAGAVVSVVATVQDMTPLEELERLRAEFLGMVSHELRTPLTTIKGSAATVLGAPSAVDTAEMLQFFRIIDEQADRMRGLISDLLDVTRIEAGTLSVAPEPTDLAALVDEAREAFLRGGARNSVEVHLAPDLPRIGADRQRLGQVLNNLFSNASKYSPDWSAIGVSASVQDVYVAISVSDEGRGVSAEGLPHLFRKFSRIDSDDLDRRIGGEGLGLAICKGIVEAHGGRIWAESEGPGLGTRFTFTIPAAHEAAHGSAPSPGPMARGRARVLAVDDEPQMLRLVRNTLSDAGYTPIVTGDPDEAVRLIAVEKPDLILLDLMLPGTDGIELMKRIFQITDAPVIFLSGRDGERDVVRAFEAGADDYIVKPFSPTELAARIEAVLRRRAASDRSRTHEPYALGDLTINYAERRVTVAGCPVQLTATEYKLLFELSVNAG